MPTPSKPKSKSSAKAEPKDQLKARSKADAKVDALAKKLKRAGATSPKSWARSEVDEGIPQFARFLLLKNLVHIANDVQGNLDSGEELAEDLADTHAAASAALGEAQLNALLRSYGKGMVQQFIGLIDWGNGDMERDGLSWALVQTDGEGDIIKPLRIIEALSEDFLEFEASELAKPKPKPTPKSTPKAKPKGKGKDAAKA